MTNWSWLFVIYLFLAGLGAGAFLTSFCVERGWLANAEGIKRLGYLITGPCIAVAVFVFTINLNTSISGIVRMVGNVKSAMSWSVYVLLAFLVVSIICTFYQRQDRRIPVIWTALGVGLALGTIVFPGILISTIFAVPFWNTIIIPILFSISSVSVGIALISLFACLTEEILWLDWAGINKIQSILISVELILIAILFWHSLAQSTAAAISARFIIFGALALQFWVLLVILGLVFPLVMYILSNTAHSGQSTARTIAVSIAVLLGGVTLRAVIIFAGFPIWNAIS